MFSRCVSRCSVGVAQKYAVFSPLRRCENLLFIIVFDNVVNDAAAAAADDDDDVDDDDALTGLTVTDVNFLSLSCHFPFSLCYAMLGPAG